MNKSMFHLPQISLSPIHRSRKNGKLSLRGCETRTEDLKLSAARTSSDRDTVRKRQSNSNFEKKFQGSDWGSQDTKPLHQIYSFEFVLCDIMVVKSKMASTYVGPESVINRVYRCFQKTSANISFENEVSMDAFGYEWPGTCGFEESSFSNYCDKAWRTPHNQRNSLDVIQILQSLKGWRRFSSWYYTTRANWVSIIFPSWISITNEWSQVLQSMANLCIIVSSLEDRFFVVLSSIHHECKCVLPYVVLFNELYMKVRYQYLAVRPYQLSLPARWPTNCLGDRHRRFHWPLRMPE